MQSSLYGLSTGLTSPFFSRLYSVHILPKIRVMQHAYLLFYSNTDGVSFKKQAASLIPPHLQLVTFWCEISLTSKLDACDGRNFFRALLKGSENGPALSKDQERVI